MYSKIAKYLGIFLIVSFCSVSVLFSFMNKDIQGSADNRLLTYPNFFEDRFYDFRMNKELKSDVVDDRMILVAIDDYSIKKVGRWPFPRENYTALMDKLKTFGAKVISYDVFFSEKALVCPGSNTDQDMAAAMARFNEVPGNKVILPYSLSTHPDETYEEVPDVMYDFIMDTRQNEGLNLETNYIQKKVFPIDDFLNTNSGIAHIEATADFDGIFRHYNVVGNVDTLYFPSLSLLTYQAFTGDKPVLEMLNQDDYLLKLKTGAMEVNYMGQVKVRWSGDERIFPKVPFWDVIMADDNDPTMKELFNGNIVFIGSTAFGAHDLRHTPVDPMMPGVYFHMNMTKMLLDGLFFKPMEKSALFTWVILIAGTLIILVVQYFGNALLDLFTLAFLVLGTIIFDIKVLTPAGFEIRLFFSILSMVLCYSWNTFLHFYIANKDKQFLKDAFGSYISPELIDEMYLAGEPPRLGGDVGVRTAFFTDIQSFSTFSEKLSAPQLVELLNEYLTDMTDILLDEKGTLDKYEGDAIIAFFGAPMPLEDHARRACMVAHRMQETLLDLRERWKSEGDKWPEIVHDMRMRVGINSGEIVTGNMGSASRMNYTMMGDSVNLAARLEESAKQYGIFTQVSKETVELAGDEFVWRELDTIKVVGKSIPVTSYDLLGLEETAPNYLKELRDKFSYGIQLYKSQKFKEAIEIFTQTLELEYQRFPALKGVKTNPSEVYLKRCEAYLEVPPPPDWDGVYTLTSK